MYGIRKTIFRFEDNAPARNQFDVVCKIIDSTDSEVKRHAPFRLTQAYLRCFEKSPEEFDEEVEYDVDEEVGSN